MSKVYDVNAAGSGGGGSSNSFTTIQPDTGTSPVATSATDTLTIAGQSPISTSGNSATDTITIQLGTVPINKGGTGQTTANAALNAFLPSQTSNSGKVLGTNGTNTSWVTPGGTPGGSATQLQFNNSGVFGGLGLSATDNSSFFLGLQQTTPAAPLHVTGASGQTIAAPASLSAAYVVETVITSPTTYNVSQINEPSSSVIGGVSLLYMDPPQSASTTIGSGMFYLANGQTIYYDIYPYYLLDGVMVLSQSALSTTYTDPINDGTTYFSVNVSYTTVVGSPDGMVIKVNDGFTTYYYNMGTALTFYDDGSNTAINDPNTSNSTDVFTQYQASGSSTWTSQFAEYYDFFGTKYRGSYVTSPISDDSSGRWFVIQTTINAPVDDGQFARTFNNTGNVDLSALTSFNDYGQTVGSDLNTFDSIAFAPFDLTLSVSTPTGHTLDYFTGAYIADGSSWNIGITPYKTNPTNGLNYMGTETLDSPVSDDNSSNGFSISGTYTPSAEASGNILTVYQNGTAIYTQYIDNSGAYSGINSTGFITPIPPISGYAGITRQFHAYGFVTSPSVKYSNSHHDVTFTDNNSNYYVIGHATSGFGNATQVKIVENSYQNVNPTQGWDFLTNNFAIQNKNNVGSDITVTPAAIGYLGNGDTYNYQEFSTKTIGGSPVYSATGASTSITLPNDSQAYVINLTGSSVSAATYLYTRIINSGSRGIVSSASTTLQDNTTVSWGSSPSFPFTPTAGPITAVIAERSMSPSSSGEPGIMQYRNTATNLYGYNQFMYTNGGGAYNQAAIYGIRQNGLFFIDSYNSGLQIGPMNTPHTILASPLTDNTVFNNQASGSSRFTIKGSSHPYMFYANASEDTIYFSKNGAPYGDTTSALSVGAVGSDYAINIFADPGVSPLQIAFVTTDQFNGKGSIITNNGRAMFGYGSTSATNILQLGSADNVGGQLGFANTSTVATTLPAGTIVRYDNNGYTNSSTTIGTQLLFTDKNQNTYSLLTNVDPASGSAGTGTISKFWRTGGNGMPVPDSDLYVDSTRGITVFGAGRIAEFKTDITMDSGKNLAMNGSGAITGPFRSSYTPFTTNTTGASFHYYNLTGSISRTFTLPTAVGNSGREFVVKNSGGVAVTLTINTTSSQTYDGAASGSIVLTQYQFRTFVSDGANWMITNSL